ncbi:hypothetical protein Taro_026307, partial [Colocasia esculenta]|nr:hypothetical protein [Colocasia esculenta]
MHTQIYSEPPPMSPYADSIGWLSEDPSTPVEPARIRISKEAAAKSISQQAEEFVDHYYQLPSSIIEEAINATFKSIKPKKPSESSIKGSPSLDQIRIKVDDKIFRQLKSLPVNITVWE